MDENPTVKMMARTYADLRVHEHYDDTELNDMHVAALRLSLRYARLVEPTPYRVALSNNEERATVVANSEEATCALPTVAPPARKWRIVGQP